MICKTCKQLFIRKKYSRAIYCSVKCRPIKLYWITYKERLRSNWRELGYHKIVGQLDGIEKEVIWLTNCKVCHKKLEDNRRKFCCKKHLKKWHQDTTRKNKKTVV